MEKEPIRFFGTEMQGDRSGIITPLAVDEHGRWMLCEQDREQLQRIERGLAFLVECKAPNRIVVDGNVLIEEPCNAVEWTEAVLSGRRP